MYQAERRQSVKHIAPLKPLSHSAQDKTTTTATTTEAAVVAAAAAEIGAGVTDGPNPSCLSDTHTWKFTSATEASASDSDSANSESLALYPLNYLEDRVFLYDNAVKASIHSAVQGAWQVCMQGVSE